MNSRVRADGKLFAVGDARFALRGVSHGTFRPRADDGERFPERSQILDEPTSALDVATEAAIIEAMGRLMHGRTTLMIAHRLSTLELCDRVIELDSGRLVADR